MKILFVIPTLANGGAERVVTVLANELVNQDYEVSILYYFSTQNEYYVDKRVKLINLSCGNEVDYFKIGYIQKLKKIRKIVKAEKPSIVIPFLSHVCAHTVFALFGTKYKISQTVRNDPKTLPKGKIQKMLRDFLIKHSYKTIVQNETQKSYFNKSIHKKISVLPNPVRGDLFDVKRKEKEENFVIASAGRLNSQKNFFMLIDAVEKVYKNHNNIELRIYGDGELRDDLQNYISDKNLTKTIKLMGRTNDMKTMFSSIDLYVLSSDFEGMPNSLMEAMAAGVPCVSTDCPTGPADLIQNEESGLLVPVYNSDTMAEAIEKMLFKLDKQAMAQKGRECVKNNFSPETIVKKLIEILKVR